MSFKELWKRQEAHYNHWTDGPPQNQIQFAFQNNYRIFRSLLEHSPKERILEMGCGRGTMSNFFLNDGFNCHMLDLEKTAVKRGKENLDAGGFKSNFVCGDAFELPYKDESFDVVFSIGLLEHLTWSQNSKLSHEVARILKSGGIFIHYVVPKDCMVQIRGKRINKFLRMIYRKREEEGPFVNNLTPEDYKWIVTEPDTIGWVDCFGVYPLPMISHSPKFPFTLMPNWFEARLVKRFKKELKKREVDYSPLDPWRCSDDYGQAYVVHGINR